MSKIITKECFVDENEGHFYALHTQETDAIEEYCKQQRELNQQSVNNDTGGRLFAAVPCLIVEKYKQETGFDALNSTKYTETEYNNKLAQMFASSAFQPFLTSNHKNI